jgi:hypothetical protein
VSSQSEVKGTFLTEDSRVLSASTQVTTNIVTSHWDPSIFSPQRNPRLPSLPLSIGGLLYGLATFLTELAPYLVAYGPSQSKLPEPGPAIYPLLLQASLLRLVLTICFMVPSMLSLTRIQARLVDPKEPTIVRYQSGNDAGVKGVNWIRITRVMIQCFAVCGISITAILLFGRLQFSNIKHATELHSWVYRGYLDPRWSFGPMRYIGTVYFWRENMLITINPWKRALPYSEGFDRWQVFGEP